MYRNIRAWFCIHFVGTRISLTRQTCLKTTEVKLELLADVDMLLMVEKGISPSEAECVMQYTSMQKPATSAWKIMIQAKNLHIPCSWMPTTCVDGWCLKNCPWMFSNGEKSYLSLRKNWYKLRWRQWERVHTWSWCWLS